MQARNNFANSIVSMSGQLKSLLLLQIYKKIIIHCSLQMDENVQREREREQGDQNS